MDSAIRLRRHTQLWEAGITSVRRIAVSGLIFAGLILLKVIEPYQDPDLQNLRQTLASQEETEQTVSGELEDLRIIEQTMGDIEKVVLAAPWDAANEELKRFFREGGGGMNSQTEADKTVRKIADQIRDAVIDPLRKTIGDAEKVKELAAFPNRLKEAIDSWEAGKIGNSNWYATTRRKDAAIEEVVDILKELRDEASAIIENRKAAISARTDELESKVAAAQKQISELNASIEQAMNEALPYWARKLISVERMVILYPWILVGIAIYLVSSAVNASRHFRSMADEYGWTADERSDPLLSSFWTLSWRGNTGTPITLIAYSVVVGALWYCLYRSQKYVDSDDVSIWLGHGLMALAVITVWVAPWRLRAVRGSGAGVE